MTWEEVRKIIDSEPFELGPFYSGQLKGHWSLLRTMARYKFVANMITNKIVLDVGCGEGLGTYLLSKYTQSIHGIDTDKEAIKYASEKLKRPKLSFQLSDFLYSSHTNYDVITAVDVIEHIPQPKEDLFMEKITKSIHSDGIAIIGTPNENMKEYESEEAKAGHINMYTEERLKALMEKYFYNVFTFGMNDEVVYTGYKPMCQYIFAVGCNKKC
jgi:2-polyprenyl-3-methyl-5-hydroxy-6-metoxy-1,4-benzoquinol methylase